MSTAATITPGCGCCGGPVEAADFGTPDARRLECYYQGYTRFCRRCWTYLDRGWTVTQVRRKVLRRKP